MSTYNEYNTPQEISDEIEQILDNLDYVVDVENDAPAVTKFWFKGDYVKVEKDVSNELSNNFDDDFMNNTMVMVSKDTVNGVKGGVVYFLGKYLTL